MRRLNTWRSFRVPAAEGATGPSFGCVVRSCMASCLSVVPGSSVAIYLRDQVTTKLPCIQSLVAMEPPIPLGSPPQGVKQRQVYVPALSTLKVKTVVENLPSGALASGTLIPSAGMLNVCAMFSLDTVVAATPSRVMVPPATALYGEPAGSAVGASSYSLMVRTTLSPLANVTSLGAIAGQCSLLVNVPTGPLSASILPIISMLTVFALAAGATAVAPAFDPPHADAETAT